MNAEEAAVLSQFETAAAEAVQAGAPVKHPSTRQLFAYWDAQRGSRRAPERDDIDPGAIRRVLADTFMLAVDARAGHPFRIAGTRVCAAFGRELRSTAFIDLWRGEDRQLLADLLAAVSLETIAIVASARAEGANGEIVFELLLLRSGTPVTPMRGSSARWRRPRFPVGSAPARCRDWRSGLTDFCRLGSRAISGPVLSRGKRRHASCAACSSMTPGDYNPLRYVVSNRALRITA